MDINQRREQMLSRNRQRVKKIPRANGGFEIDPADRRQYVTELLSDLKTHKKRISDHLESIEEIDPMNSSLKRSFRDGRTKDERALYRERAQKFNKLTMSVLELESWTADLEDDINHARNVESALEDRLYEIQ